MKEITLKDRLKWAIKDERLPASIPRFNRMYSTKKIIQDQTIKGEVKWITKQG